MGKSVLIMNTPKGCFACPFHMADFNFNLCLATRNDSIKIISKVSHEGFKKLAGRPDWCPLKPLPDKMKLTGVYGREYFQSNGKMPSYKIGWNDCIDVITGGGDSDA